MYTRIVSICAIFILIINIVGYYPVFKVDQYLVRKEIKRRIKESVPHKDLHNFQFLSSEVANLDWVKPKKEFRLDEHMYDVVYRTEQGDSTYFECINDVAERNLFAKLDEITKKQTDSGTTPLTSARKMASVYIPSAIDIIIETEFILLAQAKNPLPEYNNKYHFLNPKDTYNPPQQILA